MGLLARFFRLFTGASVPKVSVQSRTQRTSKSNCQIAQARRQLSEKRAARELSWPETEFVQFKD